MDMFHVNRERFIKHVPLSEKVDFYFDDQIGEKKSIIAAWDDYVRARLPEHKQFYGATPRFRGRYRFSSSTSPQISSGLVGKKMGRRRNP